MVFITNGVRTPRTSQLQVATLSGDFNTSIVGTYVDVTGLTLSVPDKNFVTSRCDIYGSSASFIASFRLVHGAVPTVDQTTADVTNNRLTKAVSVYQNVSGGAVTYKIQAQVSSPGTCTIYQSNGIPLIPGNLGSVLVSAPFAIQDSFATGQVQVSMKAQITLLEFIPIGAVNVIFMGGYSTGMAMAKTKVLMNNLVSSIDYQISGAATYAPGALNTSSTLGIFLFYDYTGDDITVT